MDVWSGPTRDWPEMVPWTPVAKLKPVIWAIAQGERPGTKLAPFTMEVMVGPSAVTFKEKVAVRFPTVAVTV